MLSVLPARRFRTTARATVLTAMLAVPALAVSVAIAPAFGANAATTTTTAVHASSHYTLTVTGDGTKALVFWTTALKSGATAGTTSGTPVTTLPWHREVTAKADLYQVVAIQQQGTRLQCTIRNTAGRIVSSAYSLGRSGVVTCTLSKRDLFSLSALN